ncbi:MAG TPA: 50S ribosomal protein L11 methyltransferase [Alphaproteobacteria bacterium]|nr:50S ribosomal protein L11 methyltransferase [Alphaproteobacteria bacterium]
MNSFAAAEALAFVRAHTALAAPPLLPEISLHLASELTPLWQATEETLAVQGLAPPYWAFAWVGGQALARYLLDEPGVVRGKRVLDFAAGSGVAGIAALKAGAAAVTASELEPLALAAIALNAAANGVAVTVCGEDLTAAPPSGWDVILAGDVCYERPMAERVAGWLEAAAQAGAFVLLGDPGRAYLPQHGLVTLARYEVPTTRELEDRDSREVLIYRVGVH